MLLTKSIASNLSLGVTRLKSGGLPPEDAALLTGLAVGDAKRIDKEFTSREHKEHVNMKLLRASRIIANDHENIPITLLMAGLSLLANPNPAAHCALMVTFTVARVGHTILYYKAVQPWRSIIFGLGFVSMIGIAINGCIAALKV